MIFSDDQLLLLLLPPDWFLLRVLLLVLVFSDDDVLFLFHLSLLTRPPVLVFSLSVLVFSDDDEELSFPPKLNLLFSSAGEYPTVRFMFG